MNSFTGVGNLVADPQSSQYTKDGETHIKASFCVAFNRPGKDNGADFIWVNVFGGGAKPCLDYLSKGKKVAVQGRINTHYNKETDKNSVSITAAPYGITFLSPQGGSDDGVGGPPPVEQEPTAQEGASVTPTDEDIPF